MRRFASVCIVTINFACLLLIIWGTVAAYKFGPSWLKVDEDSPAILVITALVAIAFQIAINCVLFCRKQKCYHCGKDPSPPCYGY